MFRQRIPADGLYASAVLILGMAACVADVLATAHGPGITPDSIDYLTAAHNLIHGHGLHVLSGDRLTIFPPGFPLLLAAGELVGLDGFVTVRLVQATAFAVIVWLSGALARRHLCSGTFALGITLLIAASPALFPLARMAWSEPVFIALCLAFLLLVERGIGKHLDPRLFIATGLLAGAAFAIRYAGVVVLTVGLLAVPLLQSRHGWHRALRAELAFAASATALPFAILVRNYLIDGTWLGPRYASVEQLHPVLKALKSVLLLWFWPDIPAFLTTLSVWTVLLAGLALGISLSGWLLRRNRSKKQNSPARQDASLLPLTLFTVSYGIYIVASELQTALDPLDSRLLSPIFVPLVLVVATLAETIWRHLPIRLLPIRWVMTPVAFACAFWLATTELRTSLQDLRDARSTGFGNSVRWQHSPMIASTSLLRPGTAYTNDVVHAWMTTGHYPLRYTPRQTYYRSATPTTDFARFLAQVNSGMPTFVLWFGPEGQGSVATPAQLRPFITLDKVLHNDDGTLYRARPLAANAGDSPSS